MTRLERVLLSLARDLDQIGVSFALIGGLALSVRAEPRTTRDVDVVVTVENDREAEAIVASLRDAGYRVGEFLEETTMNRLATVRLVAPDEEETGVVVDLLFCSSGIEPEVVAAADWLEVSPGVEFRVAARGHLIALKVLAARDQDLVDAKTLLRFATEEDLVTARQALERIGELGLDRGTDLLESLAELMADL